MIVKRMTIGLLMALVVGSFLTACGADSVQTSDERVSSASQDLVPAICGGIAALPCPSGQKCLIKDNYPDATGICVGQNEAKGRGSRCELVRCEYVLCPPGQHLLVTPRDCCGFCIPDKSAPPADGQCKTALDCQGLIHIMCVGDWACNAGSCVYTCASSML